MITLNDFMELNGFYYVGHLIDVDGDGWVSKEEAETIVKLINA